MLRSFVLFNLVGLSLLACGTEYSSCKQKAVDSNAIQAQTLQIPVSDNKRLIYSTKAPTTKILKSDPFLNLYLVEDATNFAYPFKMNVGTSSEVAAISNGSIQKGKITKKQVGVTTLAIFDKKVSAPSILTNSCCSLEGIVTPNGVIEKEYIERFLNCDDTSYADIGISTNDTNKGVAVVAFNPFIKNNPFNEGDIILSMDGEPVKNSATLMKDILFSKIGTSHKFKIKRGAKELTLDVAGQKKELVEFKKAPASTSAKIEQKVDAETQLYGFSFDKNLKITKIDEKSNKYGLKVGDKLLQANGMVITNAQDLSKKLSDTKKGASLLFDRNDFQFFVNVN